MNGFGRVDAGANDEAASPKGMRTRKRDSLFLSARITLGTEAAVYEVRVRNLSEGGLMIELDRMVETGTPVDLEMRGVGAIKGQVAWCTRGRIGIALDRPIDPTRARKPVGTGNKTPGFVKPLLVSGRR